MLMVLYAICTFNKNNKIDNIDITITYINSIINNLIYKIIILFSSFYIRLK